MSSPPDESPASVVGMFHHAPEQDDVVVGRQVAVDGFVEGLLRHGRRHRYALFRPERMRAGAEGLLPDGGARASLHGRRELANVDDLQLAAWHDAQFDTFAPFALRARAQAPYPVTLVHHTLSYRELLHDVLRLLLAKPHRYDALVCTSRAARRALEQLIEHVAGRFNDEHGTQLGYRGRYELIPLAVDTDRYRPADDRAEARARFDLEEDAFVLLWIGRLSLIDKADLLPLVQAFAALKARNAGRALRLVCAGTERAGERFGAAVADYARHVGVGDDVRVFTDAARFMPWKEQLYRAADVFVSPVDNIQETFGLTPLEAMASGVPQVVSDWDGYRDTVVHGETGFLVPTLWAPCQGEISAGALLSESPYDHLALAQSVVVDMRALVASMQRLIDEPALRDEMARRSRRRAEELYAWPAVIARYEALWSELADDARRAPEPQRSGTSYATPDYGRCFGHYASRALDEGALLRLSPLGRELVRGVVSLPTHYAAEWKHLEIGLLKRVLQGLARADATGEPLSLGKIMAVLTRGTSAPAARDVVARHALFLMKYGFAEEAAEPQEPAEPREPEE
ncbi:glycosyltransferase family 4 protein [Sorangium sp. So ce1389]|uniref:glycosyltransferase family 4 protein n=1 Tax=Sorangium sp. So ce1389 TaxID=3133336 RepID=UPI003F5E7C82